ncbi:MAG: hypothetical protein ACOY4H_03030 [Thermodesulfobacteriota bacterium]
MAIHRVDFRRFLRYFAYMKKNIPDILLYILLLLLLALAYPFDDRQFGS